MKSIIDDELKKNEIYISLMMHMEKYKTLAHGEISWGEVFDFSHEIIEKYCCDAKILYYLIISSIAINKENNFQTLIVILDNYIACRNTKNGSFETFKTEQEVQKKFLKNLLVEMAEAYSMGKLRISAHTGQKLCILIKKLARLSDQPIPDIKEDFYALPSSKTEITTPLEEKHSEQKNKNNFVQIDLDAMKERDYRNYFLCLAAKMLEENTNNFTPYAFYIEAAWGRIKTLPSDKNDVCDIPPPDENLLILLQSVTIADVKEIMQFMNNLALNPFWFEGHWRFIDFLKSQGFFYIACGIANILSGIIEKYPDLLRLKYNNGQNFCSYECLENIKAVAFGSVLKGDKTNKSTLFNHFQIVENKINSGNLSDFDGLVKIAEIIYEAGFKSNSALIYRKIFGRSATGD